MLNLVLFGPPGSGKGTQAKVLAKQYKLLHLSTGDMLRAEIASESDLGKEAQAIMAKGDLVSDQIVIDMIASRVDSRSKDCAGFIFDGFPRTTEQAKALDELLKERQLMVSMVLALDVSEEELTQRILKRGEDSGREDDRDESIIRNRVAEYESKTAPLANFYREQGKFKSINGEGELDEISAKLFKIVEQQLYHQREEE